MDLQYCLAPIDPDMPPEKLLGHVLEAGRKLNIEDGTYMKESESVVEEESWTTPVLDNIIPDTVSCLIY